MGITLGCFLSLSYSQKEHIKKVKIFCLQNERKKLRRNEVWAAVGSLFCAAGLAYARQSLWQGPAGRGAWGTSPVVLGETGEVWGGENMNYT